MQLALIVNVIVLVSAALQGTAGFGFNLIASPALLVLDPALVPGPALVGLLGLTVLQSFRDGGLADRDGLRWAIAGRFPGTALGLVALSVLSTRTLGFVAGAVVLGSVLVSVSPLAFRPRPAPLATAGFLSGLTETTSSIGGPPVALMYRREPADVIRGTMSLFFVIGVSISLIGLSAIGQFGLAQITLALILMPGVIVGFLLSKPLTATFGQYAGRAVLVLSTVSGLAVIVRQLV